MNNDVFISHASSDKNVADAVCSTFENSGIRCWVAPRDILPGANWAQSITTAIKSSKIMVLIFSHNSNESSQVSKELNLAVSNNLMIVPFKIDDCTPSGSMEYYLSDRHWLDAIDGDMQAQIIKLKDIIASILPHNIKDSQPASHETKIKKTTPVAKSRGYIDAYKSLWKKTFDFKSCAERCEYWKALLANSVIAFLILIVSACLALPPEILLSIFLIASAVPFISLGVRRLHDINRSGHWMWFAVTFYGYIIPLIFFCFKSVEEGNRFKK